ncbi:MAG: type II toxin-antitoxin system ParD family antitoxin [Candidatus Nanohalobium sp.]
MAVSADLPEELERFVKEEVERGRYNSKSELLRDALRLKMVEREFGTRGIEGKIGEKLEDVLRDNVSRSEQ